MLYGDSEMSYAEWFEMREFRTRRFDSETWIPLWAVETEKNGRIFNTDVEDNGFHVRSILVPLEQTETVCGLGWNDLVHHFEACPSFEAEDIYVRCDEFRQGSAITGEYPVLVQLFENHKPGIWNLHQDIVVALKLLRQENSWIRPDEDDVEVARLTTNANGEPQRLEIKNEFLKDYLCARQMALYVSIYRERTMLFDKVPDLGWRNRRSNEKFEDGEWQGLCRGVTKRGLPVIDNANGVEIVAEMVRSELWKNELIRPGSESTRVRGDEPEHVPSFKIDASGKSVPSNELKDGMYFLCFTPKVADVLWESKNRYLEWHTPQSGVIGRGRENSVCFSIDGAGHIIVYGKEIALLPVALQQIWAAYNISPEDGTAKEQLIFQYEAGLTPSSVAPESVLPTEYKRLNESFQQKYGAPLFKIMDKVEVLLEKVNRFKSTTREGFFELAKDLSKLTVDSIEKKKLETLICKEENKGKEDGNDKKEPNALTVLKDFLCQKAGIDEHEANEVIGPLRGINHLRHNAAHIEGPNVEDAMKLAGIRPSSIPLFEGTRMLFRFVHAIMNINRVIAKANP